MSYNRPYVYLGLWTFQLEFPTLEDITKKLLPELQDTYETTHMSGNPLKTTGYGVADVYFTIIHIETQRIIEIPFLSCVSNDWYTVESRGLTQFEYEVNEAYEYHIFEESGGTLDDTSEQAIRIALQDVKLTDISFKIKKESYAILKVKVRITTHPIEPDKKHTSESLKIMSEKMKRREAHFVGLKKWLKRPHTNKDKGDDK